MRSRNASVIVLWPLNGKTLAIEYDKTSDSPYIYSVQPYEEQDSSEIGDYTVARFNPETRELESLQLLFFSKRLDRDFERRLPA